jgi:prepilin-type N-terminal cleavage/methylation domain-containing protein
MTHAHTHGATLLELVVALAILSGIALASAPVAVRSGEVQARGRALIEGAHLATTRSTLSRALPCGAASSGTDTTRRARLAWRLDPVDSALVLTGILGDPGNRWPVETLTVVLRCTP